MVTVAYLTSVRWLLVTAFASLGVMPGLFYNVKPFRLKKRPLGEFVVFAIWGSLIVSGTYYTLTGCLDLNAVLASISVGLLVSAVLLANNIRDFKNDLKKRAKTLAVILGYAAASMLYILLLTLAYLLLILLVIFEILSLTSLLALLTISKGIKID